jgi:hypothetical protein
MNDDKIRELKVDELENVAGGSVIWGNYGSLDNHGPAASVIWQLRLGRHRRSAEVGHLGELKAVTAKRRSVFRHCEERQRRSNPVLLVYFWIASLSLAMTRSRQMGGNMSQAMRELSISMRELTDIGLDQIGGGCVNCGDGGPGSCPCLPDVQVPFYFSCATTVKCGLTCTPALECP